MLRTPGERENPPRWGGIPTLAAGVQAPHGCAGDANSRKGGGVPPLRSEIRTQGNQKEPGARNAPRGKGEFRLRRISPASLRVSELPRVARRGCELPQRGRGAPFAE